METAIELDETLRDAAGVVEETEQPTSISKRMTQPVHEHFTCTDLISQTFECNYCDWKSKSASTRRKLEHLLAVGGASRPCVHAVKKLDAEQISELRLILKAMNGVQARKRKAQADVKKATASLTLPKRQKKMSSFLGESEKDKLDLQFARMIIMTAVKSGFMDSPFTTAFFQVSRRSFLLLC